MNGRTMLVIGGARSGKSRHAQALAESCAGTLVFIATAQPFDDEMRDRIDRHRSDRGPRWRTVEAPRSLAAAVEQADRPDAVILVDCLTLWASNLLLAEEALDAPLAELEHVLARGRGRIILVANEVGLGIVPDNALARRFRDMAGTINQRVAASVDRVHLVVAGIPLAIK
ncbi:bifunctional adenosylcobinamide kinase/adenosylcobinamide-phosphate guanylyltransferase [uncultured Sphingomonas sp.]|uniref:bifunctional adenosylcobinamide kinase/adenosylcobinamide-phosphate guanylyltransferase n=1 Tax=uncultured Sphingomonas sp. TaxID=158754 RepID=UPI0025FF73A2|nr:bifunctional adenosylcobinamide kinase/adenosylcobinamide-phosphate guanylyltransferase [uncultured Sphingomonas sp.]